MKQHVRLAYGEISRLADEACRSDVTVRTVLKGGGSPQSRAAVREAAKRLGLRAVIEFFADGLPYVPDERPALDVRGT